MKTMSDPENWGFVFTITDLGRFLGKSPVTLRGWEKNGIIKFPRSDSGDRKFTAADISKIAQIAYEKKRISLARRDLVKAAITLIELVERSNIK